VKTEQRSILYLCVSPIENGAIMKNKACLCEKVCVSVERLALLAISGKGMKHLWFGHGGCWCDAGGRRLSIAGDSGEGFRLRRGSLMSQLEKLSLNRFSDEFRPGGVSAYPFDESLIEMADQRYGKNDLHYPLVCMSLLHGIPSLISWIYSLYRREYYH
jgi:hypothetical protein